MSTVACCDSNRGMYGNYAPNKPDVRKVVREEIKRQKELENLEERYQSGEISKIEYYINKAALNLPQPNFEPVVYSNFNCVG